MESSSETGDTPLVSGLCEFLDDVATTSSDVGGRSGVLFDSNDGENDGEHTTDRQQRNNIRFAPDDVFPVNKPPRKKWRVGTTKSSAAVPVVTSACGVSGLAVNPCQLPRAPVGERGTDLLDDRVMADIDEVYDDNEKALSEFIRLHPMLSLDATSERILSKIADIVGDTSIEAKEVEVVSKPHDDLFLRPPNSGNDERPCCNGEKCVCRWMAIFRYGEESDRAFVCREYLLPSQEIEFRSKGDLPKTPGKCLLCTRYYTTYIYTLARNSPSFSPTTAIQIQAFCNKLECETPLDDAPAHSSSVGTTDGYRASVMLFVDEKWADTSSSRNGMSALLWRPTVRFNCSDYEFVVDSDGTPRCIQINMAIEQLDFGSPPCS